MNRILFAAACALLAWPVAAETLGEKTGLNQTLGISPTTRDFVQEAASSDMYEIQSSTLAADKLNGPGKAFAEEMVTDHTKTSDQLATLAKADNVPLPTAIDSSHQQSMDQLKSLNGDDFTKRYAADQVAAHQNAVSLFERYGQGGDSVQLKTWAQQTLPTLRHHLEMAKNLAK